MSSPAYTFEDTFKGADIDPDYSNGQNYFNKKKSGRENGKKENKKTHTTPSLLLLYYCFETPIKISNLIPTSHKAS